ncbi:MAG TPA: GNAT family N-acetyltransferase [Chloroflexia bacterium]|jgi:CelD/BcsL family acetyltransferase involved in cellulose biosynthesis
MAAISQAQYQQATPHTLGTPTSRTTAGATTLHVSEVNSRAAFMQMQGEWNALVRATDDQPFYRHEWFRIWLDNFAADARWRIFVARDGEGKLVGALPLIEQPGMVLGAPARCLSAAANDHTPRFDLIAEDPEAVAAAFVGHLRRDSNWDVLHLPSVPPGGHAWRLYEAANHAGHPTGTWQADNSPYFALPARHEEMQKQLDTKFKANLRRRHKKLAEKGPVTVQKASGESDLAYHLEEGFAVEQSGWKGREGTAMAQDGHVAGFYSELARFAAHDGSLALYYLRVDGKAVAFHYGLTYGSTYYLLKPGYDESVKECSPGQLLMDEVVKQCIEDGLTEFDFLGPDMTWKRDWASDSRQHTRLYIFRDSPYGRFLRNYKFNWSRQVKHAITWLVDSGAGIGLG